MIDSLLFFVFMLFLPVFGHLFIKKSGSKLKNDKFKIELMTKIGTGIVIFYLLLLFFVLETLFSLFFAAFLLMLIAFLLFYFCLWRRSKHFEKDFSSFLIQIHVNMLSGSSFRQSFLEGKTIFPKDVQNILQEVYEIVTFSPQKRNFYKNKFLTNVVNEFIEIDKSSENALLLLLHFRKKLELIDNFRQRSREVTRSIKAQSVILSIIYLILLFFVGFYFSWEKNIFIISCSVLIFFVGMVWSLFLGRGIKWKI